MLDNNFVEIYDAGQASYVYKGWKMGIVIAARNNQTFASTTANKSSVAHSTMHMADNPEFYEP